MFKPTNKGYYQLYIYVKSRNKQIKLTAAVYCVGFKIDPSNRKSDWFRE